MISGGFKRGHQSRWWFVSSALAVALLGLMSTRLGLRDVDSATASDLRGLLGALAAISIMALGLQLVLVGILVDRARPDRVLRPPSGFPAIVAALTAAGGSVVAALVFIQSSGSFETQAAISIGIAVGSVAISVPSRSVLLGEERWRDLGFIAVLSAGVRLVITAGATSMDAVGAVLAGLVVGEVVGAMAAIIMTSGAVRAAHWPTGVGRRIRIGVGASAGLMIVIVLSSLSVGRFLGDEVEGFNQSAAVARLVFILTFTVAFVFFPALARLPIGSVPLRRSFHVALLAASATSVLAGGAIMMFPAWFLSLVSSQTTLSATTIRILTGAFACYGVAVVSLMQYVAHGSRFALCTWPVSAILVAGHLFSGSADVLAWFVLTTAVVLLLVASLPALARVQPILHVETVTESGGISTTIGAVTIVVPSYNPGPVVLQTIEVILESFDRARLAIHVIVVSDGSTDGSVELIDQADMARVTHIRHEQNLGKGAALRTGFAAARTPTVGFVDADGDLDPAQLVKMAQIRHDTGADIVFGSKRHVASSVSVPLIRQIFSRTYEFMIRHLFQLDIVDTQTGIKLYSRPVLLATLPVVQESGFALDLELFVAARSSGFSHFVEVPVQMVRQGGSTISSRTVLQMFVHTLQIFWRAKVTLRYLRAAQGSAPVSTVGGASKPV